MGGSNYSQKTNEQPIRETFRVLTSSNDGVDTYANRLVSKLTPEQKQQFEQAKQAGSTGKLTGGSMLYKPVNQIKVPQPVQQNQAQAGSGLYLPPILAKPQTQLPNQISTPAPNTQGQLNNIPSGVMSTPTSVSSASPQPIPKILANLGAGGSGQQSNQFAMPSASGLKFGGT
jgi:hypothetical protein